MSDAWHTTRTPEMFAESGSVPPDLAQEWEAALADVDLEHSACMYVANGPNSPEERLHACLLWARRNLEIDLDAQVDSWLNDGESGRVDRHRVVVWPEEKPTQLISALMRHELHHAVQVESDPRVLDLANLATEVAKMAGDQWRYEYNLIPTEFSANGVATAFVRDRFGVAVVRELAELHPDHPCLRTEKTASSKDLRDAMIDYFAARRGLCHAYAQSCGITQEPDRSFASFLSLEAGHGVGELWLQALNLSNNERPRS